MAMNKSHAKSSVLELSWLQTANLRFFKKICVSFSRGGAQKGRHLPCSLLRATQMLLTSSYLPESFCSTFHDNFYTGCPPRRLVHGLVQMNCAISWTQYHANFKPGGN